MTALTAIPDAEQTLERAHKKIVWRLMPFLGLLYFIAYFDRVTLSYAGPGGMNAELGLTASAFGFAAGLFFLGYTIFELPSNVALHKFGARAWLARIIVTWGIIQTAIAFVPNENWLYALRFLLGLAEAGFVPGVLYYLTLWFDSRYRGRAMATFLFSAVIATVIGAPLATGLIQAGTYLDLFGLSGWRFLILASGVPAVALGIVTWFYLTDRPAQAKWLTAHERQVVETALADDVAAANVPHQSFRETMKSPWVWVIGLAYLVMVYGSYALTFFLPTIVAGFQEQFGTTYSPLQRSLLVAIPFLIGGAAQLTVGRLADRFGHPGRLAATATTIGAIGAVIAALGSSPVILLAGLSLVAIGTFGGPVLLFPMASRLYVGIGAATALAIVTMHGGIGGFIGPYATGALIDLTGSVSIAMCVMAALLLTGGLLAILADRAVTRRMQGFRTAPAGGVAEAEDVAGVPDLVNESDPTPFAIETTRSSTR